MKKAIKVLSIIFASILLLLAIVFSITFVYYSNLAKKEVFDSTKLATSSFKIEVYDNNGDLIDDKNQFNNQHISIKTLPKHTTDAFISIEDKNFYNHHGVNYKRIAMAAVNNIKSRSLKEGASTITQQLVKNTQLSSEKTFKRTIT